MPESTAGPTDSVNRIADDIIEASSLAADKRIALAVRRMTGKINAFRPDLAGFRPLELDPIILTLGRELRNILAESTMAGELAGAAEVVRGIARTPSLAPAAPAAPPPIQPLSLGGLLDEPRRVSFPIVEDAVRTLRGSPVAAGADFRETAAAVQRGSFAITADLTDESLRDVRGILAENIATGPDREKFIKDIEERFESGNPLSEARWRQVFRDNTGAALSDGQDKALKSPFVADTFPYRRYVATDDARVRPEHLALEQKHGLSGTQIYWKGDSVWQEFRPPWNYGCRCASFPVTVRQAMEDGVKEAIDWWARAKAIFERLGGVVEIYLPETEPFPHETVPHPPFQAPPEFRRNATTAA